MNKSRAKSQHYIPQVMLEEWGFNTNKNIYFFDNTKKIGNIRTTESVAYENFLYSFRVENINFADENFKKRFIEAYNLNEYKFYGKDNKEIDNPFLFLSDFKVLSKIEKNGVALTRAEINRLECSIKQWNDTTLEKMLSDIENNWKLVCEKLKLFRNNYLSSNDKEKCVKEYLNPIWHYIENFVNILYIRNNEFRDSVHEYTKPIKDISYSIFENFNIINNMVETHYKNTLKQALLNEYSIFKPFNINLYLLTDNQNVILPLNYVRIKENTEIDGILLQSAIYIPLTPKIIAIVYGKHSNLITINHNLPDEYVNAINKCLIYNSKYFVANFKVDEICNLQKTPN